MKRLLLGTVLLMLSLALGLAGCSKPDNSIRFGTGGTKGVYYAYGTEFSKLIADEDRNLSPAVKTTAGSAANIRLLREGFLDLAIVQGDILSDAVNGTGIFVSADAADGYAAVAGLYTEACQIVVPKDSDIKSIYDLAGKRVSLGEKESGVLQNAEKILLAHSLTPNLLQASYLSFADSAAALENGEIDAFFCTAGAPTSAISDLATRQEIRLIPIDLGILANMQKMYKGYTICTIPANTYPGQEEDIPALGVKAILVANAAMPEKDVTRITEILFRHAEELQASAKLPTRTDISYATQDIPCAFHAGAAKYYEAQGISVDVYSGAPGQRLTAAQD